MGTTDKQRENTENQKKIVVQLKWLPGKTMIRTGKKLTREVTQSVQRFRCKAKFSTSKTLFITRNGSNTLPTSTHTHTHALLNWQLFEPIFGFWKSHTNAGQLDLVSLRSAASSFSIWFLVTYPSPCPSPSLTCGQDMFIA